MTKIGLQLYSIRQEMEKDFFGSLEKVKQAGFDCVEFAGFYGHSAKELKSALKDIGLDPHATHSPVDQDPAALAKFAAELGIKFVIVPGMRIATLEDCHIANKALKTAAPIFAAEGITIGYHNHWAEFVQFDGRYALDILMDGVDGVYEIDTAWVVKAGLNVVDYVKSLGDRVGPIHAKDINADFATRNPVDVNVCIGEGVIDFPSIISHLRSVGSLSRGLIVEQEAFTVPMFEALAKNVRALHALAD